MATMNDARSLALADVLLAAICAGTCLAQVQSPAGVPTTQPASTSTTRPAPVATTQPASASTSRPAIAPAPATQPADEPLCPVTGEKIDRQVSVQFRGRKVYFASAAARDKFNADPYAYADAVKRQWHALRPLRLQVACPVTGQPVDPAVSAERPADAAALDDAPLYFASEDARAAWLKDPKAFDTRLATCYTFQTICPCGFSEAKPNISLKVGDRTIYFCCTGCRAGFEHDPPDLKKLDEQIQASQAAWEARQRSEPRP